MTLAMMQRMTCEELWAMRAWHHPEYLSRANPVPYLGPSDCRCLPWMDANNKYVSPFHRQLAAHRATR